MPNQKPSLAPKLYVADNAAGTTNKEEITNWVSMTEPSISTESTDITDSSTPVNTKENLPGDTDFGEIDLEFNKANPLGAGQTWLLGEFGAPTGNLKYFQLNNGVDALQWSGRVASGFGTMERGNVVKLKAKITLASRTDPGATVWP